MNLILVIDYKNYDGLNKFEKRTAVRGIIIKNSKILMIESKKYHEVKFPGGGQKKYENDIDTLKREVMEETGYEVDDSTVTEFGCVIEKMKDSYSLDKIFVMKSKYYLCDVTNNIYKQNLDDYEIEYGYEACFKTIDEAIKQNEELIKMNFDKPSWINRELQVLKIIKEKLFINNNI